MYQERASTLAELEPGERAMIKHPNCAKSKVKFAVSRDMFGVTYTDLLADHVRYATKRPVLENSEVCKVPDLAVGRLAVPRPMWLKQLKTEDRWCFCLGLDNGKEMIECENEKCLIGWYHVDCIGTDVDESGKSLQNTVPPRL